MLPVLIVMGFGKKRRVPVPFPFILLWPVIAIGCVVLAALGRNGRRGRLTPGFLSRLKNAFGIFYYLSGLRIDVRSREGTSIYLRFV
jgi:hypothetical protein